MADRSNHGLNVAIEQYIGMWDGAYIGMKVKNMYKNGTSYESICDYANIDYMDYEE